MLATSCPESSSRKSFDELKEIAQHPTFSKHVTTLIYDHTFLKDFGNDFLRWNKARPDTCYIPRWVDFEPYQKITKGTIDKRSERAMRRARALFKQAYDRCPVELTVIERMWDVYQGLDEEQRSEGLHELRVKTMELAFSLYPKLDHIIVGDDHHLFSKNRARLFTDLPVLYIGVKPDMVAVLNDISTARASAGRTVLGLTISLLTMMGKHRPLLETSSPDVTTETMQGLRVFTLAVHEPEAPQWAPDVPRRHVSRSLQGASQLEVLKINFSTPARKWTRPLVFYGYDAARISHLLNGAHWPALHTITLRRCCELEDVLVSFLLRHELRLKRVAFKDCQLLEGNWTSLFTRIAGRLTSMKQVILAGYLISMRNIEFHLPTQGKLTTSIAVELQNLVIEGGAFPPTPRSGISDLPMDIVQEPFDDDEEEDLTNKDPF